MEKTIKIQDKEYKLKSSLFTIINYRNVFGTELFSDIKKVEGVGKEAKEEDLTSIVDTIFKITYILHKPYTNLGYDEFLNGFDFSVIGDASILETLSKAIAELIGSVSSNQHSAPPSERVK